MNSGEYRSSRIKALKVQDSDELAVRLANLDSYIPRAAATARSFLLFGITYALAYQYSSRFNISAPAPLWLPDSVLLCALVLVPRRMWGWYLLISFPIRVLQGGAPLWFLAATYCNDCLKAVFAALLLQRFIPGSVRLNNLKQFGIYIGIAVIGMPALSALAGAATRLPLGDSFWQSCSRWYLGDATAALALTPTLLYWCQGEWRAFKTHVLRYTLLVIAVVGSLCFTFLLPHGDFSPAVLYAPVPALILAATLFRPIGVSSAISLLALVSIISAAHGKGSFFTNEPHHGVLSMQFFLIANAAPLLFVAILLEERKAVERELRRSQSVLKDQHNQIHNLAGRLLSAQEDERGRIARELHDDISQRLALLSIGLEKLSEGFSSEAGTERALACSLLCDAQGLATDVHDLSHQLHSRSLELRGLEPTLKSLCRSVSHQHQIIVKCHSFDVSGLPADINLCLFRVAQEAISNSVRHGKAQHIDILLQKQNGHLCLAVRDDGKGFDLACPSNGLGLVSMQERLRFVGGRLEVKSRPGAGTEVDAILPLITGGASQSQTPG